MRCARTSRPEFAREKNQWRPDQAGTAQQPKTIEKTEKRSLLPNDVGHLRLRVQSSVGDRETVRHKVPG
jgi:hypothetical protein